MGVDVVDVGILAAAGAVVLFAIVYAMLRGDRRDPLERLAAWARARGLEYVAPESDQVVASFVGEIDGQPVDVTVARVARAFGNELPTSLTTVTVSSAAGAREGASVGAPVEAPVASPLCVLQPAAWVLDRDGRYAGDRVTSGDEAFDARWSARGLDAEAVMKCLSPEVRSRLLAADAEGLIVEVAAKSVAIPMPGVCADARELDRRVGVASVLARVLGQPGSRIEE